MLGVFKTCWESLRHVVSLFGASSRWNRHLECLEAASVSFKHFFPTLLFPVTADVYRQMFCHAPPPAMHTSTGGPQLNNATSYACFCTITMLVPMQLKQKKNFIPSRSSLHWLGYIFMLLKSAPFCVANKSLLTQYSLILA